MIIVLWETYQIKADALIETFSNTSDHLGNFCLKDLQYACNTNNIVYPSDPRILNIESITVSSC